MESKTKNRKSRPELQQMVERAFPGHALSAGSEAITELKEGWYNVAYDLRLSDGRAVILKIAPPQHAEVMTYERDIMRTEVAAMRRAAAHPGIPVPQIFAFDTSHDLCDTDYFFMQKLSGSNYEHVKNDLPAAEKAQIDREIGHIIRAINTFTGSYFGYEGNPALRAATWREAFVKICAALFEDGRKKDVVYPFPTAEMRALLLQHAAALDEVTLPALVHWDAWDSNFFVAEGHVTGILDFERALWADPLMEAQFRVLNWTDGTESLRAYGKTDFTPAEEVRNHLYTLHLGLVTLTETYYRHYDTNQVADLSLDLLQKAVSWLREH